MDEDRYLWFTIADVHYSNPTGGEKGGGERRVQKGRHDNILLNH